MRSPGVYLERSIRFCFGEISTGIAYKSYVLIYVISEASLQEKKATCCCKNYQPSYVSQNISLLFKLLNRRR